jgi:hypothetical protein
MVEQDPNLSEFRIFQTNAPPRGGATGRTRGKQRASRKERHQWMI